MSQRSKRKHIFKHELNQKGLMNNNIRCLVCNLRAKGESFINMVTHCSKQECPHMGKNLSWIKVAIEGDDNNEQITEIETNSQLLPSKKNEYELTSSWEFVWRDKVMK